MLKVNINIKDVKMRIGLFSTIFVVILVLAILGKTSFWHVFLFPFYAMGAVLSMCCGVVVTIAIVAFLVWFFFLR